MTNMLKIRIHFLSSEIKVIEWCIRSHLHTVSEVYFAFNHFNGKRQASEAESGIDAV